MRNIWLITLISLIVGVASCSKDDNNPTDITNITLNNSTITLHESDEEILTPLLVENQMLAKLRLALLSL